MRWKLPPRIKIYEALGAVGDKRVKVNGSEGMVTSSSGGKKYHVRFDPEHNSITSNDNGSYWQGYLGYPAIAFLIENGVLHHSVLCAKALENITWKDINTKFRNDFEQTEAYVKNLAKGKINLQVLEKEVVDIYQKIKEMQLQKLDSTEKPPEGY